MNLLRDHVQRVEQEVRTQLSLKRRKTRGRELRLELRRAQIALGGEARVVAHVLQRHDHEVAERGEELLTEERDVDR